MLLYSSNKVCMNGLGFSVLKSCVANGETDEWREEQEPNSLGTSASAGVQ